MQGAQKFDLSVERKFADFIEEQGAAVGLLEFADALVGCAGERALLVAEQNALDQIFRNGAAVDSDEGFASAFAFALDGARDQLFADATFAFDEDGNVGSRSAFAEADDAGHRVAAHHQVVEGQRAVNLLFDAIDFACQRFDLERAVHRNF